MATDPLQGAHLYKSTPDEFESDESNSTTNTVRNLIQVNRDAKKGLAAAADAFGDEYLNERFRDLSGESGRFVEELIAAAPPADLGETGSITGTLRRAWIEVNAATASDAAILEDAEAAEDRVSAAYAAALTADLSQSVDAVVRRQYEEVRVRRDEVRALRDARR